MDSPNDWKVSFALGIRRVVIADNEELSEEVIARAGCPAADGQPSLVFLLHEYVWDAFADML